MPPQQRVRGRDRRNLLQNRPTDRYARAASRQRSSSVSRRRRRQADAAGAGSLRSVRDGLALSAVQATGQHLSTICSATGSITKRTLYPRWSEEMSADLWNSTGLRDEQTTGASIGAEERAMRKSMDRLVSSHPYVAIYFEKQKCWATWQRESGVTPTLERLPSTPLATMCHW